MNKRTKIIQLQFSCSDKTRIFVCLFDMFYCLYEFDKIENACMFVVKSDVNIVKFIYIN